MKSFLPRSSFFRQILIAAALAAVLASPTWPVQAQTPPQMSAASAMNRHAEGLALTHRGDDRRAFAAFLEAAESGYPPAQRRVAEILDSGNKAVPRDYEESIRWYEKARAGGEQLPSPHKEYPVPPMTPSILPR